MTNDADSMKVSVAALLAVASIIFINIYAAIPFAAYEIWKAHKISQANTNTSNEG